MQQRFGRLVGEATVGDVQLLQGGGVQGSAHEVVDARPGRNGTNAVGVIRFNGIEQGFGLKIAVGGLQVV